MRWESLERRERKEIQAYKVQKVAMEVLDNQGWMDLLGKMAFQESLVILDHQEILEERVHLGKTVTLDYLAHLVLEEEWECLEIRVQWVLVDLQETRVIKDLKACLENQEIQEPVGSQDLLAL